ncbi:MAG: Na+/H+ antiporter subunit E [Sedimenticola sp.]|nr:Na+/H+ antiporter subunit E [Sedimenticola sp.]
MNQKKSVNSLLIKVVIFALVWWVLTDGHLQSWLIGGVAIVLALWAAKYPPSDRPVHFLKLFLFLPFFLKQSLLGGVDVARRAFQPKLPIDPLLVECSLRLPPGAPQVFMTNMVSLLPGTLSARLENSVLTMHVLDQQGHYMNDFRVLEEKVAEIFSIPVASTEIGERL